MKWLLKVLHPHVFAVRVIVIVYLLCIYMRVSLCAICTVVRAVGRVPSSTASGRICGRTGHDIFNAAGSEFIRAVSSEKISSLGLWPPEARVAHAVWELMSLPSKGAKSMFNVGWLVDWLVACLLACLIDWSIDWGVLNILREGRFEQVKVFGYHTDHTSAISAGSTLAALPGLLLLRALCLVVDHFHWELSPHFFGWFPRKFI
jgi:hypothetical protein